MRSFFSYIVEWLSDENMQMLHVSFPDWWLRNWIHYLPSGIICTSCSYCFVSYLRSLFVCVCLFVIVFCFLCACICLYDLFMHYGNELYSCEVLFLKLSFVNFLEIVRTVFISNFYLRLFLLRIHNSFSIQVFLHMCHLVTWYFQF